MEQAAAAGLLGRLPEELLLRIIELACARCAMIMFAQALHGNSYTSLVGSSRLKSSAAYDDYRQTRTF